MATPKIRYAAMKNGTDEWWSVWDLKTGNLAQYLGTWLSMCDEAEAAELAAILNLEHIATLRH